LALDVQYGYFSVVSNDPNAPPQSIKLSKAAVAKNQLETAITIWFSYGDPISILTLANASNNCYAALGGHVGKPSPFQEWLSNQTKPFQDRNRYVQNWVKHGKKDLTKTPSYSPMVGEVLMFDSIECHQNLFQAQTHLMTLFIARWTIENPSPANAAITPAILKFAKVYDRPQGDRPQFLQRGLERLSRFDPMDE
jgi:hypothetical protein